MTANILFFIFVAYLEMTNSQHCGQSPTPYQPYTYYSSASTPLSPSMYAPPAIPAYPTPMYTPPPVLPPTSPYSPSFATSSSVSMFAPPMFAAPFSNTPYQQATYASPALATLPMPYAPIIQPNYQPTTVSTKPTSTPTPKVAPIGLPKCSPPTATAYYITTLEPPKAAVLKKEVKENKLEKLPPPTYPCPFCTGFADVPKNSKVPPPPDSASVLPGILEKIPTIRIPDELKIKELGKLAPSTPLLPDLFKHKLSGKLRFDQDLLDGFLTGLGLGNFND